MDFSAERNRETQSIAKYCTIECVFLISFSTEVHCKVTAADFTVFLL